MTKKEIIANLKTAGADTLYAKADEVRKKYFGDEVHIRGICEFSNFCKNDCLYCGLRRSNGKITRYRMHPDEIVKLANAIAALGIKTVVLQSGDDSGFGRKELSGVIDRIKKDNPGIALTLSVGERPFDDYKAFKDAGADRYLLRHETANGELYRKLHPGQSLKKRMKILECLKKLNYQVGAGNIVGLPGQTLCDLADDILLMKNIDVDMAGIGPFIPQKDTPLSDSPPGSLELTLKVLALTRIVTKNAHLPVTTALATLAPETGQLSGIMAGANVIMPDFTPESCRRNYAIYDNKVRVDMVKVRGLISATGREISRGRGDSLKIKG
jgi:biotin synthase